MRKIKTLLLAAVFVFLGANAFAADATVTFVSGKVEVQRGGKWVALQKGDTVAKSETISTGFQSEAKIKILDSVMYLGPVTRITLEELSSTGQKDNVNVYLKTGTTRSQVRHTDNKRINYQVHTAVAVASCRGTEWIIDDSNCVSCLEGTVAVAAYKAPEGNGGFAGGSAEGEGEEETDSGEEKEESEETAETETADTETSDDNRTTPSPDEGVLVQANQTVTVSETSSVSAPVVTVVQTAAAVTSTVSTASEKESVGGAGGAAGGDSPAVAAVTSGAAVTTTSTSGAASPAATTPATTTPATTTPTTPPAETPVTPTGATVTVTVDLPADL